MLRDDFDRRRYFLSARFGQSEQDLLEEILERRIQQWLRSRGPTPLSIDRVFCLHGVPGSGKSWLLKYLCEKRDPPRVYLDMREISRQRTPQAAARYVREVVARASSDCPYVFLLDHLPSFRDHMEYHRLIEEEIISPALENNEVFLIAAQQYEDSWVWSTKIPHPPVYRLRGFSRERANDFFSTAFNCSPPAFFENTVELLPRAAQAWITHPADLAQACEEFLTYWLEELDEKDACAELPNTLKTAAALTWLPTIYDHEGAKEILRRIGAADHYMDLRFALQNRRWLLPYGEWEESVKLMLQQWLRATQPGLARDLDRIVSDRRN